LTVFFALGETDRSEESDMKTTRLMAAIMVAGSFGLALATAATQFLTDEARSGVLSARAPMVYQALTAQISTDWLAPVSARRSLDQRNQALERWVAARGGWVQVIDTTNELRTRGPLGERLRSASARFAQTLVIHVPAEHAPSTIAQALAGMDVTVASISAPPGQQRLRVEF
jgi:hypothetical protein